MVGKYFTFRSASVWSSCLLRSFSYYTNSHSKYVGDVNVLYKFLRRDGENDDGQIAFVVSDRNEFLYDFSSLNDDDCRCTAAMIDVAFHSAVRCPPLRKFLPMLANIEKSRQDHNTAEKYENAKKADAAAKKRWS